MGNIKHEFFSVRVSSILQIMFSVHNIFLTQFIAFSYQIT